MEIIFKTTVGNAHPGYWRIHKGKSTSLETPP